MIYLIFLFIDAIIGLVVCFSNYDADFHWVYVTSSTMWNTVFLSIDLWIVYIGVLFLLFLAFSMLQDRKECH